MHCLILGSHGVPAEKGGFETFAQDLAIFLVAKGHEVTVYCQAKQDQSPGEDVWRGIRRVMIPAEEKAIGTIVFDWKAIRHAMRQKGVALTLGYNTGVFNLLLRFSDMPNIMNMDGIEWRREKWSRLAKAWLWFNEWMGARVAHHLVADHPEIARHLSRHTPERKIAIIPYGADAVDSAPVNLIEKYGLTSKGYYLIIARAEPENSILEIVRAYSSKPRGVPLVILGSYSREGTRYQQAVLDAAGLEVRFLQTIFDREIVRSLRFHARAYFHGHRVGGTNPSLVEALAAGNAIIAHDNQFTRWVAGEGARFFDTEDTISQILDTLNADPSQLSSMEEASRRRHEESFTQDFGRCAIRLAPGGAT